MFGLQEAPAQKSGSLLQRAVASLRSRRLDAIGVKADQVA